MRRVPASVSWQGGTRDIFGKLSSSERDDSREWRNGRRAGFRCQCPYGRGGSSPPSRTASPCSFVQGKVFVNWKSRSGCKSDRLFRFSLLTDQRPSWPTRPRGPPERPSGGIGRAPRCTTVSAAVTTCAVTVAPRIFRRPRFCLLPSGVRRVGRWSGWSKAGAAGTSTGPTPQVPGSSCEGPPSSQHDVSPSWTARSVHGERCDCA